MGFIKPFGYNYSVSFHKGNQTSIAHNNRDKNMSHVEQVDPTRSHLNIFYKQEKIEQLYEKEFGEVVKKYNDKQKRADRKIKNYYQKILHDKKTNHQQELIVAIGKSEDDEKYRPLKREALDEYAKNFEKNNPNLKVYNMVLHDDEANPHLHINFVPVFESKRGLEKRVGFDKAIQQQEDAAVEKSKEIFVHWREKETEQIEKMFQEKLRNEMILSNRVRPGSHKYLQVDEYREMKKEIAEAENKIEQSKKETEREKERQEKIKKETSTLEKKFEVLTNWWERSSLKKLLARKKEQGEYTIIPTKDFEEIVLRANGSELLLQKNRQLTDEKNELVLQKMFLEDERDRLSKENKLLKRFKEGALDYAQKVLKKRSTGEKYTPEQFDRDMTIRGANLKRKSSKRIQNDFER